MSTLLGSALWPDRRGLAAALLVTAAPDRAPAVEARRDIDYARVGAISPAVLRDALVT